MQCCKIASRGERRSKLCLNLIFLAALLHVQLRQRQTANHSQNFNTDSYLQRSATPAMPATPSCRLLTVFGINAFGSAYLPDQEGISTVKKVETILILGTPASPIACGTSFGSH